MAITEISGTQTILLADAEHSLATDTTFDATDAQTTDGVLQAVLDLTDMVTGDQLRVRLYEKCRAGDPQRRVEEWILTGAQANPIWITPAVTVMHGWDVTIDATQDAAAGIVVNWSLRLIPTG